MKRLTWKLNLQDRNTDNMKKDVILILIGIAIGITIEYLYMKHIKYNNIKYNNEYIYRGKLKNEEKNKKDEEQYIDKGGYFSFSGFVPDAATAAQIATAIWMPIYGHEIEKEKPFNVYLMDNRIWIVKSSNSRNGYTNGGQAVIHIQKFDGKILLVTHYK